ncbi:MAG: response regulator [Butyricicoccus pullicaecorum]|nr:response regulator [Butyricicoccus pullicaecorum]
MYTVVVADDETELRRSLIAKTPWEECGFQVVGEAENGMEALELVERLQPDLLLTDIRMPFLSGIALARAAREIRPAMHIAFLSGYDDFAYAQQAIQYNIIRYLLKPISSAELAKELVEIREKIDSRMQEVTQGDAESLHPHDFLMPLLLGADTVLEPEKNEAWLCAQAIECGILSDCSEKLQYVVLATLICDGGNQPITTRRHIHAVDRVLHKYFRAFSCFIGGRVISLVADSALTLGEYLHIATSEISQTIERATGEKCTVGVSRPVQRLSACHGAYREALDTFDYMSREDVDTRYIADFQPGHAIQSDYSEAAAQLESLIKGGKREELHTFLQEQFDYLRKGACSGLEVGLLTVQLLSSACRTAGAVVDPETANTLWRASPLAEIPFTARSLEETAKSIETFCCRVAEAIVHQCRESGDIVCEQALAVIQNRYADTALSLVTLSESLHISPNYLSALIRKHTGDTFINLLTAKRLDTAKELLQCTRLKVMEIAERCGYTDQHYFSYCFKKRFGISPLTLRRQQSGEGGHEK